MPLLEVLHCFFMFGNHALMNIAACESSSRLPCQAGFGGGSRVVACRALEELGCRECIFLQIQEGLVQPETRALVLLEMFNDGKPEVGRCGRPCATKLEHCRALAMESRGLKSKLA